MEPWDAPSLPHPTVAKETKLGKRNYIHDKYASVQKLGETMGGSAGGIRVSIV